MKTYTHRSYESYFNTQYSHTDGETSHGTGVVIWASEMMLKEVNELMHSHVKDIRSIVCHGCRNGFEVDVLKTLNPGAEVFGTDIYGPAYKYDRNYFREIDFDIVPDDWREYFDVVYSNSIDHCRNPVTTLLSWKSELRDGGICFVTFQFSSRRPNKVDCFYLSPDAYRLDIDEIANKVGMKIVYCSEPRTSNSWRGMYVHVIFKK